MPSEISGLAPLRGYLKSGNLVTRLSFPYIRLPQLHPALIERLPAPSRTAPAPATPSAFKTGRPPEHRLVQPPVGEGQAQFIE